MEQEKFQKNIKEIKNNDWFMRMCDTAIVENDIKFITALNTRFERFKSLFIDES